MAGDWAVTEGVLTTLVTASLGNEKICRCLLRVGLEDLIDAAEDHNKEHRGNRTIATILDKDHRRSAASRGISATQKTLKQLPEVPELLNPMTAGSRGPATDEELGLDLIDEIGVQGVLRKSSEKLARNMLEESRESCSALATSLLQVLGPFNYVSGS